MVNSFVCIASIFGISLGIYKDEDKLSITYTINGALVSQSTYQRVCNGEMYLCGSKYVDQFLVETNYIDF